MISVGTHEGKMVDYGIAFTKDGLPQFKASFEVIANESVHTMIWFGSFKEGKARDITIKTLIEVMDLFATPSEIEGEMVRIAEMGKASGILNCDKKYSLIIEHEPDLKGATRSRIRWVNNPGLSQTFERLAQADAKRAFSGLNLAGAVADYRAKFPGITKKKPMPF